MKKEYWISLLLILLLAAALRFAYIGKASIRADEGYSVFVAEKSSFSDIVNEIKGDNHPFLDYTLLHFWIKLGKSEAHIRMLFAILSTLSVAVVFFLGREIFDEKVGILSSLIMVVSQFNVRFAQTARSYALQLFLASLSCYFFVLLLKEKKWHYFALYVIASAIMVYSHYYTFLLILAQIFVFFALYREQAGKTLWFMASQLGIFAILAPWIPMVKYQLSNLAALNEANVMASTINLNFFSLSGDSIFVRMPMIIFHFSAGYLKFNIKSYWFILLFLAVVAVFGYALLKAVQSIGKDRKKATFLFGLFIVPILIIAVLWTLKIMAPLTYARYLIFIYPLYCIIISKGILEMEKIKFIDLRVIAVIIILAISSTSLYTYYKTEYVKEDWRMITNYINENAAEGDVIALLPVTYVHDFTYYYKGNLKMIGLPNFGPLIRGNYTQGVIAKYSNIVTEKNSCDVINATKGATGVFYVRTYSYAEPQKNESDLIAECLGRNYKLINKVENAWIEPNGEKVIGLSLEHYKPRN